MHATYFLADPLSSSTLSAARGAARMGEQPIKLHFRRHSRQLWQLRQLQQLASAASALHKTSAI